MRLRRICSTDKFFETQLSKLECYLVSRGYKRRFVIEQISRAQKISRNEARKEKKHITRETTD